MLSDFFTKPLQFTMFEILGRVIMGWYKMSLLKTESMYEFKERVGNDKNGIFNPEMDLSPNWTPAYTEAVMGD